jgi:hypothetical protein
MATKIGETAVAAPEALPAFETTSEAPAAGPVPIIAPRCPFIRAVLSDMLIQ